MISLVIGGMANGAIYGLVALGIVLIFRTTGVVNFAQSEFLMAGAYAYLLVSLVQSNSLVQLVIVAAVGVALGMVFFLVIRYLFKQAEELQVLIATLAMSIILLNLARVVFTDTPSRVSGWVFGDRTVAIGSSIVTVNSLLVLAGGLTVAFVIHFWLRFTDTGRAMRAVAENRQHAALSGIPVSRMLAISWILGGIMAALGGLLLAPAVGVYPNVGQDVLFKGFVAATLGGFDSVFGAMVGGVLLGVIEVLGVVFVGGDVKDVISFGVLLLVLLARPTGLLGRMAVRRT